MIEKDGIGLKLGVTLVLSVFALSGCWYAPWESQKYVSTKNATVGGVQVTPMFQSSDPGLTSGEPPFVLRVIAFGTKGVHDRFRVDRVKVLNEEKVLLQDLRLGVSDSVLLFKDDSVRADRVWASTDFHSEVQVPDASNASLAVELMVQANSNSTWISDTLEFEFVLQERRGRFGWITN